jgi:hypothetical protein
MNEYPPQPEPQPYAPAPVKRRNPWKVGCLIFVIIGVLAFIGIGGAVALFAHSAKEVSKNPEINAPKKAYALNQAAKDGKFTFVVTKASRATHMGISDAQGEFIVLTVRVTNHGTKAQMLDASSQKLLVGNKTYDADGGASSDAFLKDINPGNSVTAKLAFDVPKGTRANQVVLHDSPFSNGVRISLP